MNRSKEPKVSEVDNDQDEMTDNPILERRPKLMTTAMKTIRTVFHTFTINEIKLLSWTK